MTKDSHTSMDAPGRELALGLLGSAAFGGAAAVGHGPWMAVRGAWMAPALFVGGALLATPPLYMFKALAGSRQSALATAQRCTRALAAVGTALLGLAAPAAYLSATLTTRSGPLLLLACCAVVGCAGIAAITGETLLSERKEGPRAATALWAVFAMLLGVRLLSELIKKGGA